MKFRLTIEYDVPDEEYGTKDRDEILSTEQWLLSIKGASHYFQDMCNEEAGINANINLEQVQ